MNSFDHFCLLLLNVSLSYLFLQRNYLVSHLIHQWIHWIFHFFWKFPFVHQFGSYVIRPLAFSAPNVYDALPDIPQHHKALHIYNLLQEILSGNDFSQTEHIMRSGTAAAHENGKPGALPYPTVVLDLDETLLHVTSEEKKRSSDYLIWDEDHRISSRVYKRPYVDRFLSILSCYYEIILFTSSYQCYCDPLVDLFPRSDVIIKRFYNTSLATLSPDSTRQEKDLYLTAPYNMPHRLLLVDDKVETCSTHPENLYLIPSYLGQEVDYALIGVLFVLISLTEMKDFRVLLSKRTKGFHS
jgi:CTD nuclear envelope phosphatase 1